jgi:hypothetical protein
MTTKKWRDSSADGMSGKSDSFFFRNTVISDHIIYTHTQQTNYMPRIFMPTPTKGKPKVVSKMKVSTKKKKMKETINEVNWDFEKKEEKPEVGFKRVSL